MSDVTHQPSSRAFWLSASGIIGCFLVFAVVLYIAGIPGRTGGGTVPVFSAEELRERLLATNGDGTSPPGHWTRDRLRRLMRDRLRDEHIIVVANREPYVHERQDGEIRVLKPASGLVTALDPIMRSSSGVWIAHGAGSADRECSDANGRLRVPPGEGSYLLRRIWLSDPPSPVTMIIIAEVRSAFSTQVPVRSLRCSAAALRYASNTPMPNATTGHPRYNIATLMT